MSPCVRLVSVRRACSSFPGAIVEKRRALIAASRPIALSDGQRAAQCSAELSSASGLTPADYAWLFHCNAAQLWGERHSLLYMANFAGRAPSLTP